MMNDMVVDLRLPLVTLPERHLSNRFAAAEAAWVMSGDNRVSSIQPFNSRVAQFSDDGSRFFGAYGPRVVDQLPHVLGALERDHYTRQAVLTIWRPSPPATKDVPCTVAVQWLYRDGRLHCLDYMRSSDAWLGVPYDLFTFAMLTAGVALELRRRGLNVQLGNLYLTAGSRHLYLDKTSFGYDEADVRRVCDAPFVKPNYEPLNLDDFHDYDDLVAHLWRLARHEPVDKPWLEEVRF